MDSFDEYQDQALSTAIYPSRDRVQGLTYTALGLVGEAGEFSNKVKKIIRGDLTVMQARTDLISELGDTLWYVAACCNELGVPMSIVAQGNLTKLRERKERGKLAGEGDNR